MNTKIFALWVLAVCCLAGPVHAADKPNVLFIAVDDLNDWVGPLHGHPQVKTPNMDKLAARGLTFTNAHCQAPLCNSSRTSLLTGLRPSTTGVYALGPWFRTIDKFKDWVTLPQYFSQNGYTTLSTGKIFHGGYGRGKKDHEFQILGPPPSGKPFPPKKLVNTPADHKLVDWGTFPHEDKDKGDWICAEWAVEKLKEKPKEPFFLSVGFFLPHVPCYATQKWFDLYPEDTLQLPPIKEGDRDDTPRFSWYLHWKLPEPRRKFLIEAHQEKNIVRSYLACISFVDSQIGRLLDSLEESGHADDTVVVLWSDHGFHLGEKAITGKNTLWERSTHVPLIFAGPGVVKGAECHRPAELLDIYPTLVDLCGLPEKTGLEGHSLMPQIKDPSAPREFPAITTHGPGNHSVRTETHRYIRYADGSEELYDLKSDPNEWNNLAKNPEYAEIKKKLGQWAPKENAKPAEGSTVRLVEIREDGKVYWQGEPIGDDDPIPEL